MAKRTQKAGATARYGARYGVSVRRRAGAAIAPAFCVLFAILPF
jgi:ribosomal protein L37AE/L43A